jgi:prolyl-tRNA synthetase
LQIEEEIGAGILGIPTDQEEGHKGHCPVCGKDASVKVYVARKY